jgi:hypothetical protein
VCVRAVGHGAVIGLRLKALRDLLAAIDLNSDHLWNANLNSGDQLVLGGTAHRAGHGAAGRAMWMPEAFSPSTSMSPPTARCNARTTLALAGHLAGIPTRTQTAGILL